MQRPWSERKCGTFEKAKESQCGWNRVAQDEPGEWARGVGWKPDHDAPVILRRVRPVEACLAREKLIAVLKKLPLAAVERTD